HRCRQARGPGPGRPVHGGSREARPGELEERLPEVPHVLLDVRSSFSARRDGQAALPELRRSAGPAACSGGHGAQARAGDLSHASAGAAQRRAPKQVLEESLRAQVERERAMTPKARQAAAERMAEMAN